MKLSRTDKQILRDADKRPKWIEYQIKLQGRTMAQVARDANVTPQQAYKAMRSRYPRMEYIIAAALGLRPMDVFPERYDADGIPVRGTGIRRPLNGASVPDVNTQGNGRNVKTEQAA